MRWARWIDHLPLWVALGATVATDIYEPGELVVMALPLGVAAAVEILRWDLGRHHRWLEVGALIFFLADLARGRGVFPVAIHTLFLLAGVRLALPRELPQRRQLVLMGFLLFLATAASTTDLVFLLWSLLWLGSAAAALLQQAWETSASLRRGVLFSPPYARVPAWMGAALVLGAGFFLILPRLNAGLRPRAFLGTAAMAARAGFGDQMDLGGGGPIAPNPEVVLRIVPPPGTDTASLAGSDLLRGVALETVQGMHWSTSDLTPPGLRGERGASRTQQAEFLFSPSAQGILTLPYGTVRLRPDLSLRLGGGGSIRWRFPQSRPIPLDVVWSLGRPEVSEPWLAPRRLEHLTELGSEHEAARRWSLRFAPGILSTPELAKVLEQDLRGFRYTLDNPSGRAANPLEDFLDRTQAGHCEYFASAMALMLRARGVPARVVNGFRLGPWIPEGGYFRVSQDQAHSWVEYWDQGRWHVADPTPATAGQDTRGATSGLGLLVRWLDNLRYQWDRHVVRFSDQDQMAGLSWMQARLQGWEWRWKAPPAGLSWGLALVAAGWVAWRTRRHWRPVPPGPGSIRALRPLLDRTRRGATPLTGETARAWLLRLGALRPERAESLRRLADAVETEAYGGRNGTASALAKAEAVAWRGWKAPI
ncbi:transglutaminase TgpA family protein [Geothrix oryzisoli]|uniref:transglutaminase TgpA family protein n=1 Tax=Geothrix oryzisoli TaxID=2922721 RepID=UPI001FAE03D0